MRTISVIMGVYRPQREKLVQAIASVLTQDLPPLEVIVCDDGSKDGTFEFLLQLAAQNSKLIVLRHPENRGLAAALNTCIRAAKGEYIARQDDDDYSLQGRFSAQASFLENNADIQFTGCAIKLYDENGIWAEKKFAMFPDKKDFLFAIPFMHGTLMFRAQALKKHLYKCGRFTRRTEDYELLMRMYAAGCKGANLPQAYYCYLEDERSLMRRKLRYRLDEVFVKLQGFRALGLLWQGLPYLLKPVLVGLIPPYLLRKIKKWHYKL